MALMMSRGRLVQEAGRAVVAAAQWGPAGASAAAAACAADPCCHHCSMRSYSTAGGRKPSSGAGTGSTGDMRSMVAAYVKSAMAQLSIPSGELASLLNRPTTSEADILDWAAERMAAHTARDAAAPHLESVRALRAKVGAASAAWQAPRSPSELLLQMVGAEAVAARLEALPQDQLRALPEYTVTAAALATRGGASEAAGVVAALRAVAPQLLDAPPLDVLQHPAFWRHTSIALQQPPRGTPLVVELVEEGGVGAWGRNPRTALDTIGHHQQALADALGETVVKAAAALAAAAPLGGIRQAEWLLGVAQSGPEGAGRVAALRLAQWVAAQLGLSTHIGCGLEATPAWEVVRRLSLVVPPPPALPQPLTSALAAAAPGLESALSRLPAEDLAQGRIDFEQLLARGDEAAKTLALQLAAWRAAAAAEGSVPALCGLTRAEVDALPSGAFDAVRARVGALGLAGQRAMSAALAAAEAGRSPMAFVLSGAGGASQEAAPKAEGKGDERGVAAAWERLQPLAWAVHTGGAGAPSQLLGAVLIGAGADYLAAAADVARAQRAVDDIRTAFALEVEVARRSSVARPDNLFSGETQQQVEELLPPAPKLRPLQSKLYSGAASAGSQSGGESGSLLATLAAVLPALSSGGAAGALRSWREVRKQLSAAPRQLPAPLQGLFDDLLAEGGGGSGGDTSAAAAEAQVDRLRQRLAAFLAAWDAAVALGGEDGAGQQVTTEADFTAHSSGWSDAAHPHASALAVAGLVDLVGADEAAGVLASAAEAGAGGKRRSGDEDEWNFQPYELMERVQHDIHIQQYLANEFDPSLGMELSSPPVGWCDPRLAPQPSDWLEGMRPLLDAHLEAHGEEPLHDLEWKVYKGVALSEAADVETTHEAGLRARGHSGSHNSAADAAALRTRLAKGLPQGSVLGAAAAKYLEAALVNPSWTFAARRRLVDRLVELARHLAEHPPKSFRGSPFSAVLQPDGPPLVPRLSRSAPGRRARRGVAAGVGMLDETDGVPAG